MEKIQRTLAAKKFKKIAYIALVALLAGWVIFRFAAVASENSRFVFNASRVAADTGLPVMAIEMSNTTGTLYEPLAVKNNRAYVSGARAKKLRAGQKVGDGKIVSVSSNIDYDTGMYVVRTSGVADGLQMAEFNADGHFVPLYAVTDGTVYVAENGVAVARNIEIARQDSETAYIKSGLNNGDVVILSSVRAGDKVQIKK
ncbi:MAG: hypothetical protein J6Q44_02625 [Alphaproteobacteria bacterium]|nr:hypothetical protein [Alphaproteobacteria bacterium]